MSETKSGGHKAHAWLDQLKKAKLAFFAAASCAGLFFVILFIHVVTTTSTSSTPKKTLIVFSDGLVDDMIALNYLLHRSDVQIPFIVISNGPGSATAAYRNVVGVLKLSALRRIPQVLIGSPYATIDVLSHNCTYSRAVTSKWAYLSDSLFGTSFILRAPTTTMTAVFAGNSPWGSTPAYFESPLNQYLAQQPAASVTFVSLGPLTDVAGFVRDSPFANRIARIYVSGGTLTQANATGTYFGAAFPVVTLNFFLDPLAANTILEQSSIPTTLVLSDAVSSFFNFAPSIFYNPSSSRVLDSYIAVAVASWLRSTPSSASPWDLATCMTATDGLLKVSQTVSRVGVLSSTANLRLTGKLGAVTTSMRSVSIVTSVNSGSFWADYEAVVGAPWPL